MNQDLIWPLNWYLEKLEKEMQTNVEREKAVPFTAGQ